MCQDISRAWSYLILTTILKQGTFVLFYNSEAEIWFCEMGCPGLYRLSVSLSAVDHTQP